VVGVAVGQVGLIANGDLGLDLIANAVVIAVGLVLNGDVGVDLVELDDGLVQDGLQRSAHLMVEGDGHGLAGVEAALGHDEVSVGLGLAAGHCAEADRQHQRDQQNGGNDFFHGGFFLSFGGFI
jgi:hypothetical protein